MRSEHDAAGLARDAAYLLRRQNQYYKSDEEFLHALAEALREEYKAIVDAGLILQLDDPGLPDTWDMANPEPSVDAIGPSSCLVLRVSTFQTRAH